MAHENLQTSYLGTRIRILNPHSSVEYLDVPVLGSSYRDCGGLNSPGHSPVLPGAGAACGPEGMGLPCQVLFSSFPCLLQTMISTTMTKPIGTLSAVLPGLRPACGPGGVGLPHQVQFCSLIIITILLLIIIIIITATRFQSKD
jgi:hypothetical protein